MASPRPQAVCEPSDCSEATSGRGVFEVVEAITRFRTHSESAHAVRRKTRSEYRLRELVSKRFMDHLERDVLGAGELRSIVDRIAAREVDPYTAANELLRRAIQSPDQLPNQLPDYQVTRSPDS